MLPNEVNSMVLTLGVMGIVLFSLWVLRRRLENKGIPAPETTDGERGPGRAIMARIDLLNRELRICGAGFIAAPVLMAGAHFSYSYFAHAPESRVRISISVAGGIVLASYYFFKLRRQLSRRRRYHLGYEDELAVARELSRLSDQGYQVYHDFPGEQFKIDHVVIGPSGVMAIETNTRAKGAGRRRKADVMATYDGRMLHFPKYSDHLIIDQAKLQAEWLSQWLSTALGRDISARAIVALPGWFVKRTSADGIPVINPNQIETLFKHIKPRPLSPDMIQRICRQIENRCRELDPHGNSCYVFSQ